MTHTTAFATPVMEHWLEREIDQWVNIYGEMSRWPKNQNKRWWNVSIFCCLAKYAISWFMVLKNVLQQPTNLCLLGLVSVVPWQCVVVDSLLQQLHPVLQVLNVVVLLGYQQACLKLNSQCYIIQMKGNVTATWNKCCNVSKLSKSLQS